MKFYVESNLFKLSYGKYHMIHLQWQVINVIIFGLAIMATLINYVEINLHKVCNFYIRSWGPLHTATIKYTKF